MTASATPGTAALGELAAGLPEGALVTDVDVVEGYRRDRAAWAHPGQPLCLVRATGTADVVHVLRWASAHRVPVVPRGAGSGLSGGATAVDGCVLLSLERMDRICEVDPAGMYAVVQPGVVNADLKAAARAHGLWYPPDPASYEFSTIGGNLATNAGGLCCVKYGVTRDYVLGLEVVLADGTVVRTGGHTVKNVAGYDLTRLFVGSEGTLGVVTEAVLRLRPAPPPATTLAATFPTLVAAGAAVSDIVTRTRPSLLELMDRATLQAVEDFQPMGLDLDAAALLVARSDSGGAAAVEEVAAMAGACRAAGATLVEHTDDPAEGEMFLAVRRLAYPAMERRGATLVDDVAVPLPLIPRLVAAVEEIAERHGTLVATVGHAGDGNMHPLAVFDPADPDAEQRALAAFADIMRAAIALGGTITGEHGVGTLKRPFLAAQVGEAAMGVQRAIKAALDPLGILNPGKVL